MLATDLTFETSLKLAGLSLGVAACLIPLAVLWTKMQSRIVITTYIVLCSSLYAVALLAAASWGLDIRLPISLTAVFGLAFCLLVIAIPSMDDADKEKTHDFEGLHT
ncbi:hypothetical protein SFC66_04805 [Terribacillus saccharophilus]|uniref:hypothetical protein n=1 Tax=Terribacillus saccharophilus TaxID=361277 RepID=UPI003982197F